jgi:4-hydroxybenzoate polyprenyltransferase
MDPEEDVRNKPDRPLASKRITLKNAIRLRILLVPICIAFSALYSFPVMLASIAVAVTTLIYNELGAHSAHWIIRNVAIAIAYGMFEAGASLVASKFPQVSSSQE